MPRPSGCGIFVSFQCKIDCNLSSVVDDPSNRYVLVVFGPLGVTHAWKSCLNLNVGLQIIAF